MLEQKAEKPASQGPQVTTQYALSTYNLLAAFNTLEDGRKAIETLGRAGVEAKHITLGGPAPDEAAIREDTAEADKRMMTRWFSLSAEWAAVGAIVGAVVGIPVGLGVIASLDADVIFSNMLVAVLLGALFGGVISGLVGSMYSLQAGDTWELTFQQTYADKTIVGVHSNNAADIDKARDIFQKAGALSVRVPSRRRSPQDAMDATARAAR